MSAQQRAAHGGSFSLSIVRSQASAKDAGQEDAARNIRAYRVLFDILSMAIGNIQVGHVHASTCCNIKKFWHG